MTLCHTCGNIVRISLAEVFMGKRFLRVLLPALAALFILPFCCTASADSAGVSGIVWVDKNTDGIYQSNESALSGAQVTLERITDSAQPQSVVQSVTDKSGGYSFGSLPSGSYRLRIVLPKDYQFTLHGSDSAALPASGRESSTAVFTLSDGDRISADIGATKSYSYISVIAFEDLNENGGRMSSEPLIRNVGLELEYVFNDTVYTVASAVTDKNGEARITSLSPGTYRVRATLPEGYIPGPLGQKVNTFYNFINPSDSNVGCSAFFDLPAKSSVGMCVGMVKTGALSGSVWFDEDSDGKRKVNDSALENIQVELYSSQYALTRTAQTDAQGNFSFVNLQGGEYDLRVLLPDGMMFTHGDSAITSSAGRNGHVSAQVTVGSTAQVGQIGLMKDTALRVIVFHDTNLNGSPDEGEEPLPGIPLKLSAQGGGERVTDETGTAVFNTVSGGRSSVRCTLPEEYVFTCPGGSSLLSALTGMREMQGDIDIAWGEVTECTVGVTKPSAVSGLVFEDPDLDGVMDAASSPLPGFTVQLLDESENVVLETSTSEDGSYIFRDLIGGNYAIRFLYNDPYIACDLPDAAASGRLNSVAVQNMDWGQSSSFALTEASQQVHDAALYRGGTVSGTIAFSDTDAQLYGARGPENVVVTVLNAENEPLSFTDVTRNDGTYYIKGIRPGTYRIRYDLPDGCTLTDRKPELLTEWISAPVEIDNGTSITMPVLSAVMTASLEGRLIHLNPDGTEEAVTADVFLQTSSGSASYSCHSDENGFYRFEGLFPDEYQILISVPEDYVVSGSSHDLVSKAVASETRGHIRLNIGESLSDMDVTLSLPAQISGIVFYDTDASTALQESSQPIRGMSLLIRGEELELSVDTDENGAFVSPLLFPGDYTITLRMDEDCILTDKGIPNGTEWTVPFTLADGEKKTDFTIPVLRLGLIEGTLWNLDGGNTPFPAITVSLSMNGNVIAQKNTDSRGSYSFDRLYPGTYILSTVLPDGYLFARETDVFDRDSVILNTGSAEIHLLMGQHLVSCDIGIGLRGGIGDTAWLDGNGNGLQDIGEPGMPGIHIALYQYGEFIASTETDVYGRYSLKDLYPGAYDMTVTMPDELRTTVQNTEYSLVNSDLPETEDTTVTVEGIIVPSGSMNLNYDLGFVLRKEGVLPEEMEQIPTRDWTPYTQR